MRTFMMLAMLALVAAPVTKAQTKQPTAASDASWVRTYAPPNEANSATAAEHLHRGSLESDPRFIPLLRATLPQRQSWWVNGYGGSATVIDVVQEFLGIPNDPIVDDNRYVTLTGCVPHDCTTHGMLWIDTGTKPATVIFVGEDIVGGGLKGESGYHVYLYTSRELATYYAGNRPIGIFSPNFRKHLAHWQAANISQYDDQKVLLVTTVWPNGKTDDSFWSDFVQPSTPSTNPGANQ
jgi:hypothetical protein